MLLSPGEEMGLFIFQHRVKRPENQQPSRQPCSAGLPLAPASFLLSGHTSTGIS